MHLALGYIDMRKGIDGLAMLVQRVLRQDPFTGHLFVPPETDLSIFSDRAPGRAGLCKRCRPHRNGRKHSEYKYQY